MKPSDARQRARESGKVHFRGRLCSCGRRKRYTSNGACVECHSERARKRAPERAMKTRRWAIDTGSRRARGRVQDAIRRRQLVRLSKVKTRCTDCNARATQYDHRDYNHPLDVEPVCRSCNRRRGPAVRRVA